VGSLKAIGIGILVCVAVVLLIVFYGDWQHWMAIHTGSATGQESNGYYAYWSGFGSVFPWSMGILAAILNNGYQAAKRNNCHTHKCWRIGSYPAGDYKVCKKHHAEVHGEHPTIEYLKKHVEEIRNGRSSSDPGSDSQSDHSEHVAVTIDIGGVPGPDHAANAAGPSPPASG